MGVKTVAIIFAVICAVTLLIVMIKRKCILKGVFASIFQGVAALYAVKLLGMLTGVTVAVNWYTLGTAAVLGSSGVAFILAAQTMFS